MSTRLTVGSMLSEKNIKQLGFYLTNTAVGMFVKCRYEHCRISLMTWYEEQIKINTNYEPGRKVMSFLQLLEALPGVCGKTDFSLCAVPTYIPWRGREGAPRTLNPFDQHWYALGQLCHIFSFPQILALILTQVIVDLLTSGVTKLGIWSLLRSPDHCHLKRKRRRRKRKQEEEKDKVKRVCGRILERP